MKPPEIDGIKLDKNAVTELRNYLITVRDGAIKQNALGDSFNLSIIIALMANIIEELES